MPSKALAVLGGEVLGTPCKSVRVPQAHFTLWGHRKEVGVLPADEPETFGHFPQSPSNPATPTSQEKGRNPGPGHMWTEPDPEATHATLFLGSTQDRQMHRQSRLTAGLGVGEGASWVLLRVTWDVLKAGGRDGHTTSGKYQTPLNCIHGNAELFFSFVLVSVSL